MVVASKAVEEEDQVGDALVVVGKEGQAADDWMEAGNVVAVEVVQMAESEEVWTMDDLLLLKMDQAIAATVPRIHHLLKHALKQATTSDDFCHERNRILLCCFLGGGGGGGLGWVDLNDCGGIPLSPESQLSTMFEDGEYERWDNEII